VGKGFGVFGGLVFLVVWCFWWFVWNFSSFCERLGEQVMCLHRKKEKHSIFPNVEGLVNVSGCVE
jgi:hypothetical protein